MRGISFRCGLAAIIPAAIFAVQLNAAPVSVDHKPKAGFSVADNENFLSDDGGPMFARAKAAFDSARNGNGAGFSAFLAPKHDLVLSFFNGTNLNKIPFDAQVVRAASDSCVGPFYADEGKNWVQMSWLCGTGSDTPLSKYLTFRDSPELAVTVFFDGKQIESIDAGEPISFPGARRFTMDAADMLKAEK